MILIGLLLIIAGPHFGHLLTELFPIPQAFGDLWPVLRLVTIFLIIVGAVELQYYLAPNRKQNFMDTLPGSIVAVLGIFLTRRVLPITSPTSRITTRPTDRSAP